LPACGRLITSSHFLAMWWSHLWRRLELPGLELRLESSVPRAGHPKLLRVGTKFSSLLKSHHVLLGLLSLGSLSHCHSEVVESSLPTRSAHPHARHSPVHWWKHISKGSPRESLQPTPGHHLLSKISLSKLLLQFMLAKLHHPTPRAALQEETTSLLVHAKVHDGRRRSRRGGLKSRSGVGTSPAVARALLPVVRKEQEASS